MAEDQTQSRRKFLKASAAAGVATSVALSGKAPAYIRKMEPSDTINVAYIGVGVRGKQHMRYTGFMHPDDLKPDADGNVKEPFIKNLPEPLNIRAYAVCDCFTENRKWAKEAAEMAGYTPKVHEYHQEVLDDPNVDAIFIGTSDHNHPWVGIAAAQAGKAIYSEKSFAITEKLCNQYRDAVKKNNVVFQLGHQTRSGSLLNKTAQAIRSIDEDGAIGKISHIEVYTNRNTPKGAWNYVKSIKANPETVNWKQFLGKAPKREFDTERFFRWRKFWDYGSGLCADLLTHEMDAVEQVTGLGIPDTVVANGGIHFWHEKRETPDTLSVCFHYEKEMVNVVYNATLSNSWRRERRFFGRDGTLDMSQGVRFFIDQYSDKYQEKLEKGEFELDLIDNTWAKQFAALRAKTAKSKQWTIDKGIYIDFINGKEINVTALHTLDFVTKIRAGDVNTNCNIDMAFKEGIIAVMATEAFRTGRRIRWDRKREKLVKDA